MLTEKSTYEEMRRVLFCIERRLIKRSPTTNAGLRGKVERARLHGQRVVRHEMVVEGQPVTIEYDVVTKLWNVNIFVRGERLTALSTMVMDDGVSYMRVITAHALERYVQRYVKHDEKAVVSRDELEAAAMHCVFDGERSGTVVYDSTSGCYFHNFEGGAFLTVIDDAKKLIVDKTFLTVSRMKINQSIANGVARRESKAMMRMYGDREAKQLATLSSMRAINNR